MLLLDTDTCIRFLRDDPEVKKNITRHDPESIHISILTIYELRVGIEKSTFRKKEKICDLAALIELLKVVPFSDDEASESARIRAELEKKGTPIGSIDYLIAGIALSHDCILVTGNTKEFKRVKGLKIETW
jgi:tRNA(fMet)-specific endonuclease VapC